jgi:hypothetical protein
VANKALSKHNKALSKRRNQGKALRNAGYLARVPNIFKLFKNFWCSVTI